MKGPAWEDLAPWRPPETDTQQEDPGSDLEFAVEYGGILNRPNAGMPQSRYLNVKVFCVYFVLSFSKSCH